MAGMLTNLPCLQQGRLAACAPFFIDLLHSISPRKCLSSSVPVNGEEL